MGVGWVGGCLKSITFSLPFRVWWLFSSLPDLRSLKSQTGITTWFGLCDCNTNRFTFSSYKLVLRDLCVRIYWWFRDIMVNVWIMAQLRWPSILVLLFVRHPLGTNSSNTNNSEIYLIW